MKGEVIQFVKDNPRVVKGSTGLRTQVPGGCATVSVLASVTGGIASGNFVETD